MTNVLWLMLRFLGNHVHLHRRLAELCKLDQIGIFLIFGFFVIRHKIDDELGGNARA